jgi:hypothetical protein
MVLKRTEIADKNPEWLIFGAKEKTIASRKSLCATRDEKKVLDESDESAESGANSRPTMNSFARNIVKIADED